MNYRAVFEVSSIFTIDLMAETKEEALKEACALYPDPRDHTDELNPVAELIEVELVRG